MLVALAGRWWTRRRRSGPDDSSGSVALASITATTPTFRIVALGMPGAGKTLLLASMFHELQAPARQSYYLSAQQSDAARLNTWFTTVADTSVARGWPSGTTLAETRRFVFGARIRAGGSVHEVLRLDYLDYAGELLTDIGPSGVNHQADLLAHIESAHALIGIIDGLRIRRFVAGEPDGWARLAETLNVLIPQLMSVSCPISFVITKWDTLDDLDPDEDRRLAMVRDILMSNDQFRALVAEHSRDRVVRLIPVSAVGAGFTRLDSLGRPVKIQGARLSPANVDVPLSVVVPDVFDQAEARLNEQLRAELEAERRRRARQRPLERLATAAALASETAGRALVQALGTPMLIATGDVLMGLFLDARPGRDGGTEPGRAGGGPHSGAGGQSEAEKEVQEFLDARRRVLREMRAKADALEGRLPGSRLSDRWSPWR
jgi:hypothetical protein